MAKPYFETVKVSESSDTDQPRRRLTMGSKSFADIKVADDGVPTAEFLEASDGLVKMFGTTSSCLETNWALT